MEASGDRRLAELAALKQSFLVAHTPPQDGLPLQAAQQLAEVALLLALPNPGSAAEVGEQIEALLSSSLRAYAAAHPSWAYPVMTRVQQRIPDPAQVPARQANGRPWTPATWRMHVALVMG